MYNAFIFSYIKCLRDAKYVATYMWSSRVWGLHALLANTGMTHWMVAEFWFVVSEKYIIKTYINEVCL